MPPRKRGEQRATEEGNVARPGRKKQGPRKGEKEEEYKRRKSREWKREREEGKWKSKETVESKREGGKEQEGE